MRQASSTCPAAASFSRLRNSRSLRVGALAAAADAELREAVAGGADKIGGPLEHHIAQEDNVLFPAYAQASGGPGLVAQFEAEHREILQLRDELLAACESNDSPRLGMLTARFAELIGDHMRREDMMLFPSARDALG